MFILSLQRCFAPLRMTGDEGLRMTRVELIEQERAKGE